MNQFSNYKIIKFINKIKLLFKKKNYIKKYVIPFSDLILLEFNGTMQILSDRIRQVIQKVSYYPKDEYATEKMQIKLENEKPPYNASVSDVIQNLVRNFPTNSMTINYYSFVYFYYHSSETCHLQKLLEQEAIRFFTVLHFRNSEAIQQNPIYLNEFSIILNSKLI